MPNETARLKEKFKEWQKAILIFATILSLLLFVVGVVLGPFASKMLTTSPLSFSEHAKLCLSGWVGWLAIGTIINSLAFAIKFMSKR